jgi:hypothetical protein
LAIPSSFVGLTHQQGVAPSTVTPFPLLSADIQTDAQVTAGAEKSRCTFYSDILDAFALGLDALIDGLVHTCQETVVALKH